MSTDALTVPSESAAPARYGAPLRDHVLGCFRGRLEPVRVSPLYRVGLLLVTAMMVLLPLAYLGLVAGAGWSLYWWVEHARQLLGSVPTGKAKALLFIGPLAGGVALVFFMVKPLFAPSARGPRPLSVSERDEPLLFAYVARLCQVVGAPKPSRIDVDCQVNASASFRRGLLSFVGDDLVLTLGLPLVEGLSLQQLTGVLAHELGHFAQGASMRLTYVVRTISHWFVRVVYERDGWDERLAEARKSDSGYVVVFGVIAAFFVWLSRRVLWVFLHLGHALSCFQLRQMEYDADRYEARMVGAATFESTCRELGYLSVAYQKSLADLQTAFREGHLADSLPALVGANRQRLPPQLTSEIRRQVDAAKTGFFDTHPADPDRIQSARREGDAGVFQSDLPATALFRDFHALAVKVSGRAYESWLGRPVAASELKPVERMTAEEERADADRESLHTMTQGVAASPRSVKVVPPDAADGQALRRQLTEARSALAEGVAAYRRDLEATAEARQRRIAALRALALIDAKLPVPAELGLQSGEPRAAEVALAAADRRLAQLAERMAPFEALVATRFGASLRLIQLPEVRDRLGDAAAAETLTTLVRTGARLHDQRHRLDTLSEALMLLQSVVAGAAGIEDPVDARRVVAAQATRIHDELQALREVHRGVAYPFEHAQGRIDVGAYLVPSEGDPGHLGVLVEMASTAVDAAYELEARILGRLAHLAEQAERVVGLEPLPSPWPQEAAA